MEKVKEQISRVKPIRYTGDILIDDLVKKLLDAKIQAGRLSYEKITACVMEDTGTVDIIFYGERGLTPYEIKVADEIAVIARKKPVSVYGLTREQIIDRNGKMAKILESDAHTHTAVKIAIVESEAGWGRNIDDWMVCLTAEAARKFQKEYNSKNTSESAPDWYMQVEGDPEPITLNDKEFELVYTSSKERILLSLLKSVK